VGEENGPPAAPRQGGQAGDVVRMLVGDEDGLDAAEILADEGEPCCRLFLAQPGID
jgi:hypothetical protein